ncbi:MAG: helix-turn-helix domain-containing protein [Steroidobacterales bacterium]
MDEGAAPSQSSSPGARLAAAREHAGMTLAQAAERLHLDVATLQALEAGRFQTLGAAVFVHGHLRHYAELVGLPVGEIEAAYAASSARLAPLPDLRRTTTLPGSSASWGVALPPRAALIGAIVLVLAALVWWAMRVPAGQRHAANPSSLPASPSLPAAPRAADAVDAGPAPAVVAAPVSARSDTAATSKNAAASKDTAPAAKAVPGHVRLAIKFNQDSWTEIYDARGSTLFHDFGGAGSERRLTGVAPLRILLGNPDGVALELDGHPVALRPAADSGKPQRFLLDDGGRISELPTPQSQGAPSAPSTPP